MDGEGNVGHLVAWTDEVEEKEGTKWLARALHAKNLLVKGNLDGECQFGDRNQRIKMSVHSPPWGKSGTESLDRR